MTQKAIIYEALYKSVSHFKTKLWNEVDKEHHREQKLDATGR